MTIRRKVITLERKVAAGRYMPQRPRAPWRSFPRNHVAAAAAFGMVARPCEHKIRGQTRGRRIVVIPAQLHAGSSAAGRIAIPTSCSSSSKAAHHKGQTAAVQCGRKLAVSLMVGNNTAY